MSALTFGPSKSSRSQAASRTLWLATALACVGGVTTVHAQTESQTRSSNMRDLEEVVVTAQRRQELLQNVPISISAVTGVELDRSTLQGVTETLNRIPGIAATSPAVGNQQVVVRGVTAAGIAGAGSSTAGFYIDSVPFGFARSAMVPDINVYDLERVEVLRGPQGTLYGASSLNGVVRVLTRDPDLEELQFKVRGTASTTQDGGENFKSDLAVNVPVVTGKMAVRAAVGYQDLSGWLDKPGVKDANDAEIGNARLKVSIQPTENLSFLASAWSARNEFGAQSIGRVDRTNFAPDVEPFEYNFDAYGFRVNYDFANFSISSVTSYLEYDLVTELSYAPLGADVVQVTAFDSEVFSEEVTLSSTSSGPWRWSLGGIYRDGEDRRQRYLLSAFPVLPFDYVDISESYAVFGEVTRAFLDGRLELTAGARYFEDEVTNRENISFSGDPTAPLGRSTDKFDALTPRLVLTWYPSEDATFYASYAEGFRSGLTQTADVLAVLPSIDSVDADSLKNYELGTKISAWDGRFEFETAVYYMKWDDVQQVLGVSILDDGQPPFINALVNGESASGVGVDLMLSARPVRDLHLSFTASWNDLTLDSNIVAITSDGPAILFNKGDRLVLSPEKTFSAAADYSLSLGRSGLMGRIAVAGNYISHQDSRAASGLSYVNFPGDDMLIARASVSIESEAHWSATLFVDNLNDEDGSPVVPSAFADWDARVRPRTIGLQIEYRY